MKRVSSKILWCAAVIAAVHLSSAQGVDESSRISRFAWRNEPVSLDGQLDTVSPEIRKLRDAYWNKIFPASTDGSRRSYFRGGVFSPKPEAAPREFHPGDLSYAWIIGRFESYKVYETPDGGGFYTEMHVQVQYAFQQTLATVTASSIDIAERGGSVKDRDGQVKHFLVDQDVRLTEPGHTYLMEVIPCNMISQCGAGGFYWLGRKWDLTSGTVLPVDDFEVRVKNAGVSHIAGRDASTIIPVFNEILDRLRRGDLP